MMYTGEIKLTGRERALLTRGYDKKDITEVSRISKEETREYAERIFRRITEGLEPEEHPTVVFVGAQPGGGKSTMIRANRGRNFVVLAMDNYRTFHPNYSRLEEIINTHWRDRKETYNDSPGSDIADFTQLFAGDVVDLLEDMVSGRYGEANVTEGTGERERSGEERLNRAVSAEKKPDGKKAASEAEETGHSETKPEKENEPDSSPDGDRTASGKRYSILYEWAMRMSAEPLNSMRRLKARGYRVVVCFIAVNKKISLEACRSRSIAMNSKGRVLRTIPDNFHALSVERLPGAINEIYEIGFRKEKVIDRFGIIDRAGHSLWDEVQKTGERNPRVKENKKILLPGDVFRDVLWNGPLDLENSDAYSEDAYIQEIKGLECRSEPEKH